MWRGGAYGGAMEHMGAMAYGGAMMGKMRAPRKGAQTQVDSPAADARTTCTICTHMCTPVSKQFAISPGPWPLPLAPNLHAPCLLPSAQVEKMFPCPNCAAYFPTKATTNAHLRKRECFVRPPQPHGEIVGAIIKARGVPGRDEGWAGARGQGQGASVQGQGASC